MSKLSYIENLEIEKYVIDQLSQNRNLNNWEKGFIKNIKEYTSDSGFLSDKQKNILSDIWEKY